MILNWPITYILTKRSLVFFVTKPSNLIFIIPKSELPTKPQTRHKLHWELVRFLLVRFINCHYAELTNDTNHVIQLRYPLLGVTTHAASPLSPANSANIDSPTTYYQIHLCNNHELREYFKQSHSLLTKTPPSQCRLVRAIIPRTQQ